jgi:hypothetical protein
VNLRNLLVTAAVPVTFAFVACGSGSSSNQSGSDGGDDSSSGGGSSGGSSGASGSSSGTGSSGSSGGSGSSSGGGPTACTPGSDAGVTTGSPFTVNLCAGPARQFKPPAGPTKVSPYVYGVNQFAAWQTTTKWGVLRWGGDSFTDWNWTNDWGNSGSDFCFWQGSEGGGTGLAGAIAATAFPSVPAAQMLGFPSLVTVPVLDHVASSAVTNNVWSGSNPPCPGTPSCSSGSANGYAANVANLDFVSTDANSTAFVANHPTKGSTLCTCAGSGCGSACTVNTTGPVYQDEFVNFVKVTYGSGSAPIFFSLDNEPNYWPSTHPEEWPYMSTPGCGTSGTVTSDDIVTRDTTYATAIKTAWPQSKVFGPIVAQDGIVYGGDYSDPNLSQTTFSDYYLAKMAAAPAAAGQPLLDVFDVHYYTSNGSASQCMQVPRMFWDPMFKDFTAAQTDSIDFGWSGQNNYFDTNLYPRQMIPRLLGKIDTAYSGKSAEPGLSFSEYNPGCETTIEGGVAEADLLGIFGREGVFAATAWPLQAITDSNKQLTNYLVAAYDLYRNYDGQGSTVGDTAVYAQTSDVENTSVYAFTQSGDPAKVDLVVVNKGSASLSATIAIASAPTLTTAAGYILQNGKAGVVPVTSGAPTVSCSDGTCRVTYTLPATSATTIALH